MLSFVFIVKIVNGLGLVFGESLEDILCKLRGKSVLHKAVRAGDLVDPVCLFPWVGRLGEVDILIVRFIVPQFQQVCKIFPIFSLLGT